MRFLLSGLLVACLTFATIAQPPTAGPYYQTVPVTKESVVHRIQVKGHLQPIELVEVAPEVSGKIQNLTVREGDGVEKGQILFRLDAKTYEIQLKAAEAALKVCMANLQACEAELQLASVQLKRLEALFKQNAITERDVQTARGNYEAERAKREALVAEVDVARVELEKARVDLEACSVHASVSGGIHRLDARLGMLVGPGSGEKCLLRPQPDRVALEALVPQYQIGSLRPGQQATFSLPNQAKTQINATVRRIRGPSTNRTKAPFKVLFDLPPVDNAVVGLEVDVEIVVGKRENVVVVPVQAVDWRPLPEQVVPEVRDAYREWRVQPRDEHRTTGIVWIPALNARGAIVRPVAVRLGASDGRLIEVTKGKLTVGDLVVTGLAGADALDVP